jgi:hypothetical protein
MISSLKVKVDEKISKNIQYLYDSIKKRKKDPNETGFILCLKLPLHHF